MTRFAKLAGLAGVLLLTAAPALRADEPGTTLREGRPVTMDLGGNASAMTYWVQTPEGWHVVTTVDTVTGRDSGAESHAVMRFSAVLLPGQSQVISVPCDAGKRQQMLRIRRDGDRIEVKRIAAPSA